MKFFALKFIVLLLMAGGPLLAQEASDGQVLAIEVSPPSEKEFISENLPFQVGDIWSEGFLDLSRRFIKATNRYESFSVDWNPDDGIFKVIANSFLYFEGIEWRGDEFKDEDEVSRLCINQQENISLSQQRLSELTNCIVSRIRGRGFLDAKAIVFSEDGDLIVELNLGAAYKISKTTFEGRNFFSSRFLQSLIRNSEGKRYRAFALQDDTEEIWNTYMERHFYLAEVSQPSVEIDPRTKTVEIEWRISEGPRLDIEFVGGFESRRFLEELIETGESLPDWFIEEMMGDIKSYLQNEGYLDVEVSEERTKIRDEHYRVRIVTKKGRQYLLRDPAWVGLKDPEAIEKIYLRGTPLDPGRRFGEEAFKEEFENRFFSDLVKRGYLNVKVRSLEFNIDRKNFRVEPVIYMDEGDRVIIKEVNYEGVRPLFKNIVEMRRIRELLKIGKALNPIELENREAELLEALRNRGFLDSKVRTSWEATIDGYRVNVLIDSGPRYRVADLIIRGLQRTHIQVVAREILIDSGDFYSRRDVEDTVSQILRLGLARSVDVQVFEKNSEKAILYLIVDVREAARFRFELGPGFGTTDGVRGVFRGTYANIAGTGRRLSLFAKASRELEEAKTPTNVLNNDAEKEPFIERRVTLEYFEPFMFNIPVDGRIAITHERESRRQFSVENNSVQVSLDWRINRNWTYSPAYKIEFSDPFNIDITDTAPVDDSDASRFHSIKQRLEASYLDDTFSPQKGVLSSIDFEVFDTYLGGDQNFWLLTLNQTFYYPVVRFSKERSLGFALSLNQGFSKAYSSTEEVPVEKRFRVGGENSVRGYAQDAVIPLDETGEPLQNGGLSTFYFRSELNFPVYKNFDFLTFFDGGNIFKTNMKFNPFDLRYGAGLGVRFNTPVGPVKFGYAFALFRKEGEDVGQIYFGVGPL